MRAYVLRRTLQGIPLLLVISVLVFALINLAPGGPEGVYASDPFVSPEDVAKIREIFGLNEPIHVQYLKWLENFAVGNWGNSFQEKRPVFQMVMEKVPNSLLLSGTAMLIALAFSIPIAIYTATHRGAVIRQTVDVVTLLGISTPSFWTGTIAILVLAGTLKVLPSGGMTTIGKPFALDDLLRHLLLPAVVLASMYIAQWVRYLHTGLLNVINEDYVRTARAKGLVERVVLLRHALRNSLIPFITILVLQIPQILSGAIVIEIVFSWPGVGRVIQAGILRHDYPVVMSTFTMISGMVIFASIVGDILYAIADPRIRYR